RLELRRRGEVSAVGTIDFRIKSIEEQVNDHVDAIQGMLAYPLKGGYTYGTVVTEIVELYETAFESLRAIIGIGTRDVLTGFELLHFLERGRTIYPRDLPVRGGIKQ